MIQKIKQTADSLLFEIAGRQKSLEKEVADAEAAIAKVRDAYAARLQDLRIEITALEKELIGLVKEYKKQLFSGDDDRLDLEHGALIYSIEKRIIHGQKVLANLKKQGFSDFIKISESVDWDALSKWPDKRLEIVGTKRVKKEQFAYELCGG